MMKKYTIILLSMLFVNCSGQQNKNTATSTEDTPQRRFQMATVPSILTSPEDRADFLVKHYWDHFDFADTAYIHLPEVTEQAFVDYLDILPIAPYKSAVTSINGMLKKAEETPRMFTHFIELYEKYLYDPNSPFRNDELYIPVLEYMIASPLVTEKVRPTHLLEIANRNRVGEKATDFTYTLANGQNGTLYKIKSDYTLLFFYNPGCHNCKEITEMLMSSLTTSYMISEKKLTILAVYPDEDLQEWKNYLNQIPAEWINSYDKGTLLQNNEVYDLKAIPTIYLLDKEKTVLLKDASFEQLENYLRAAK